MVSEQITPLPEAAKRWWQFWTTATRNNICPKNGKAEIRILN